MKNNSELSNYEKFHKRLKKKFQVNKYILLTLERDKTVIYVAFKRFRQCKYMLLIIPLDDKVNYSHVNSIDELEEFFDKRLEIGTKQNSISPDVEFWGHCSNLQTWAENNYDSRLLHRNLAFPLLKRLTEIGDLYAKKVFRKEIMKRLESKYPSVVNYLIKESYLKFLPEDYTSELLNDMEFISLLNYDAMKKIKEQGYTINKEILIEKIKKNLLSY